MFPYLVLPLILELFFALLAMLPYFIFEMSPNY